MQNKMAKQSNTTIETANASKIFAIIAWCIKNLAGLHQKTRAKLDAIINSRQNLQIRNQVLKRIEITIEQRK